MIRLQNVTKVYGDGTEAVRDVSFEVPRGETASLVGPSGCGKTTTMTMINRLTEITEGEIYVDGTPVSEYDPIELRRNIGYVIQEIGLFDHMTVEANVSLVPGLLGWDDERIDDRVDELLELIRLPGDVRDRYPDQLSGGQQQRVGVARALAGEPDILLMDEPFGALDPITREQLQDEFLEIQRGLEVTIVFVTHDIDEALKMGDRVAVLDAGELVQYAAPRELLANPANEFVESFVGEDRLLKQLQTVTVAEVMDADPAAAEALDPSPSLRPTDTLTRALQLFIQHDSPLPVVDGRKPIGVLSEAAVRGAVDDDQEVLASDRE